jgi:hypothetical protein
MDAQILCDPKMTVDSTAQAEVGAASAALVAGSCRIGLAVQPSGPSRSRNSWAGRHREFPCRGRSLLGADGLPAGNRSDCQAGIETCPNLNLVRFYAPWLPIFPKENAFLIVDLDNIGGSPKRSETAWRRQTAHRGRLCVKWE